MKPLATLFGVSLLLAAGAAVPEDMSSAASTREQRLEIHRTMAQREQAARRAADEARRAEAARIIMSKGKQKNQ